MKNIKKNKNNKGFTLVELLAVIVVLAIIMVIAIPNVINSLNKSTKAAFKVEAQKVLSKAEETYMGEKVLDSFTDGRKLTITSGSVTTTQYCYDISDLIGETAGKTYKGIVIVSFSGKETKYNIKMSNGSYYTDGYANDSTLDTKITAGGTTSYESTTCAGLSAPVTLS